MGQLMKKVLAWARVMGRTEISKGKLPFDISFAIFGPISA